MITRFDVFIRRREFHWKTTNGSKRRRLFQFLCSPLLIEFFLLLSSNNFILCFTNLLNIWRQFCNFCLCFLHKLILFWLTLCSCLKRHDLLKSNIFILFWIILRFVTTAADFGLSPVFIEIIQISPVCQVRRFIPLFGRGASW